MTARPPHRRQKTLVNYAKPSVNGMRAYFVPCEADYSTNKISGKIQDAEKAKVHTMLVIGGRKPAVAGADAVSVRPHHGGPQGAKSKWEGVAKILANIKERNGYSSAD